LAGVWQQQQTARPQPQVAVAGALAKGAICVNNNAKASSGAKIILATFIQAVMQSCGCHHSNIQKSFVQWRQCLFP
jgi:hypothetical protein